MAQPQLSLTLITFAADDPGDWSHLVDRAVAADQAGLDRLAVSDHVAFGADLSAYADPTKGGIDGGRQPTGPDGLWLEPLTVISHLTAVTERVRFATNILLAALRRPIVLAKSVATIDTLSGTGQIVITNSGEVTPSLSRSIAILPPAWLNPLVDIPLLR